MKKKYKILIGILSILFFLIIALIIFGNIIIRKSWPKINGKITINGIQEPVEIIRDKFGVPQIYAKNYKDLLFSQGYVHAQDRLWQMEIDRRLCKGTFSEFIGSATIDLDRYMRTIGLYRGAVQSYEILDPTTKEYLNAYASGVNAFINSSKNHLPIEYTIFGFKPEPWTPIDTIAWTNMLSLQMGLNFNLEILYAEVLSKLGIDRAKQLFPSPSENTPPIISSQTELYQSFKSIENNNDNDFSIVAGRFGKSFSNWGSNNWVVDKNHSESSSAFLCDDTHLGLMMPSAWYENGLHCGDYDCIGFSLPGVPYIIMGHNNYIAWGITNLDPDVQDLYIEKLDNSKEPTTYEYKGKKLNIEVINENIPVKGGDSVNLKIYFTVHGPIINNIFKGLKEAEPTALRWTLYEGSEAFKSLILLNHAKNWDEFKKSLIHWDTLSQNFVYADVKGNIGYQAAGKIPIRNKNHKGNLPVPGWSGEYEWLGYIPFEKLPSIYNPSKGIIATANNRVMDNYPYQICSEHFSGYRIQQIDKLLNSKEKFSIKDMQKFQTDVYSLAAEGLRPYFINIKTTDEFQEKILKYLKDWDLNMDIDSIGATIFETWYIKTIENVIGDELSDIKDNYLRSTWIQKDVPMLARWMKDRNNLWFDDINTSEIENREDIIYRSFVDAIKILIEKFGKNPENWKWGKVHKTTLVHLPIGQSGNKILEKIFNIVIEAPGGNSTINQSMYYRWGPPFAVFHGTSQRMIIDTGNFDNMLVINSTGQSNHVFHPNRGDMVPLYQKGEYHSLLNSRDKILEIKKNVLILIPK